MPVFKSERRLTHEEALRDRRWSTMIWNALVPAAQADSRVTLSAMQLAGLCVLPIAMLGFLLLTTQCLCPCRHPPAQARRTSRNRRARPCMR